MGTCTIEGCEKENYVRGLCQKHNKKLRVYGDPKAGREQKRERGEGTITKDGYRVFQINKERKIEHVLIIEKALGHPIQEGTEPHHVDGKKSNNVNSNLVLCDSRSYHMLLHQRTRALKACGHASWRKCVHCRRYDDPANMYVSSQKGGKVYHRKCDNEYNRKRLQSKGGKS